ncbi:MAG: histidine kinase dimerization/phosphoacceptor domain -containing protein [Balneolales bacterium]
MKNDKTNILLIDDDEQKHFLIKNILEDSSLNLITCTSGEDGLRQLLKEEFAVILLDVNMPGMDGFETAQLIRNRPKTKYTPIIFITAYDHTDMDVVAGYSIGAVDFIFSPIKREILKAKIMAFVDLYRKTQQIEYQKTELEELRDHLEETVAKRTSALEAEIAIRKTAEKKIKDSLVEKEVLLAEIHHRVKNNLAIVSALLRLEMKNIKEKKLQDILDSSMSRIESISMIHEKLYKAESFSHLKFKQYIEDLVDNIFSYHDSNYKNISVDMNIEDILINLNQAIPCALILNELLNNAYKHAFKNKEKGNLSITIAENNNRVTLTVQDDGVGLPPGFAIEKSETLGTQLVSILTQQLQADLKVNSLNGACFMIDFLKSDQPGSGNAHFKSDEEIPV